jgi:hypothetical protein
MKAAIRFIETGLPREDVLFTDYQTCLLLGLYLSRDDARAEQGNGGQFRRFTFAGHPVISSRQWSWTPASFREDLRALGQPEDQLQVVTFGGGATLLFELMQ